MKLAKELDVQAAARYMRGKHGHEEVEGDVYLEVTDSGLDVADNGRIWNEESIAAYVKEREGRVLLFKIDGWWVDVTDYAKEHVRTCVFV